MVVDEEDDVIVTTVELESELESDVVTPIEVGRVGGSVVGRIGGVPVRLVKEGDAAVVVAAVVVLAVSPGGGLVL